MVDLIAAALGLGLAGIDPTGLLIGLGALAAGALGRTVLVFTTIVVAGTAVLGTVLSLTIARQLQDFEWTSLFPPDWIGATIEALLAAALLTWAVVRLRRPEARPPRPDGKARTGKALAWGGVLFAVSAPLDPTFVALVVLAGRGEPVTAVGAAHLTWILVSQMPLVALAVAIILGRHARAVAWLRDFMPRARPVLSRLGTAALAVAGLIMATDAAWWLVSGRFLLPDPT